MKRVAPRLGLTGIGSMIGLMALCGCGSGSTPGGFACTQLAAPGVVVSVYDSRTGLPAATGATVTLQDGAYTETLSIGSYDINNVPVGFSGAYERAGTYTVRVTKPGYTSFEQTGVSVTSGVCQVNTASVRADLVPTP